MSYDVVPEGEEGEGFWEGSGGMSIAVPRTPSSVEGSKRLSGGMTRWDSRERMRFPRPPGTSATGERESLISTEYVYFIVELMAGTIPPSPAIPSLPPRAKLVSLPSPWSIQRINPSNRIKPTLLVQPYLLSDPKNLFLLP